MDCLPDRSSSTHVEAVEEALARSTAWLLEQQHPERGYWVYELEADTTLTSEYLMLRRYLGVVDEEREARMVRYLQGTQLEDGGWPIYVGAPMDVSASVKAYFALKLAGVPQDDPGMQRARQAILAKGGVVSANVFTKITLALFGQYDWIGLPSMPPEILLAPKKFSFNVYAISYWSRAVLIPLLIVFAIRRECRIPRRTGDRRVVLYAPGSHQLPEGSAVSKRSPVHELAERLRLDRWHAQDLREAPASLRAETSDQESRGLAAGAHAG